jgi:transcriptional regulator with XRE-family HTH domain
MGPMTNLLFFPSMVKPIEECPNRIREWRERRDRMSMAVLAARAGISQQHLSRMETGKKSPSVDQLDRIAAVLDVSVGELLHPRQNPYLPSPRQRALLEKLGDEQAMRTAEAVADAQRSFNGAPPDPTPPDIAPAPPQGKPPDDADRVA